MAKVDASIVHDEFGEIQSVSYFEKGVKAFVLTGAQQRVFETKLDQEGVENLISSQRVDVAKQALSKK
ncbi:hypothetical protein [Kaistia terrae]|uniref:Uncharacterized protein n=1 Tax=Kaistia terrae TaxID=537017 RepID=A0ABW0PQX8_9HYPH|nr:hypothetical protein [Kaistia terrae]MCX5578286.1 hypothetical protein [Kaistia terrae]